MSIRKNKNNFPISDFVRWYPSSRFFLWGFLFFLKQPSLLHLFFNLHRCFSFLFFFILFYLDNLNCCEFLFFTMSTSEITVSNNSNPSEESNFVQKIGDLQNIRASYRLNGKNYLKWSQFVRTYLKGKGRLSHLLKKYEMEK